jgi:hypothetical protein
LVVEIDLEIEGSQQDSHFSMASLKKQGFNLGNLTGKEQTQPRDLYDVQDGGVYFSSVNKVSICTANMERGQQVTGVPNVRNGDSVEESLMAWFNKQNWNNKELYHA